MVNTMVEPCRGPVGTRAGQGGEGRILGRESFSGKKIRCLSSGEERNIPDGRNMSKDPNAGQVTCWEL